MDIRHFFGKTCGTSSVQGPPDAPTAALTHPGPDGPETSHSPDPQRSANVVLTHLDPDSPVTSHSPDPPGASHPVPLVFGDSPHQPTDLAYLPLHFLQSRKYPIAPQNNWFQEYPWLHCDAKVSGMLCFSCAKASSMGLLTVAKYSDQAFTLKGFSNWKNAHEKFKGHQQSHYHRSAREALARQGSSKEIHLQLNSEQKKGMEINKRCLLKIITSLKFLARQGLAIRGKAEGNFKQLLMLRADDDPNFQAWISRKTDYTSDGIQNELLEIMAHTILREICKDIMEQSRQFAIVVDGTQDVAGTEQESICIRYVDRQLNVHEDCLGLYAVSDTTGKGLCSIVVDSLIRHCLPIQDLRFQTYDGASNMSGIYKGCQAAVKEIQPLALYVHCGALVTHLICSKAVEEIHCVRNSLNCVNEVGKLKQKSGKFRGIMLESPSHNVGAMKPICPTRWLTRSTALRFVVQEYELTLHTLERASNEFGTEVGSRANGLLQCFQSGVTVLGLLMAQSVVDPLEKLNKALQSPKYTVRGMLDAVHVVKSDLESRRCSQAFDEIFHGAQKITNENGIQEIAMPRRRKVPKKLHYGAAEETQFETAQEYYRMEYYRMLDKAVQLLSDYFESNDLNRYNTLYELLLQGVPTADHHIAKYAEISVSELAVELPMFRRTAAICDSLDSFRAQLCAMVPEVKALFPNVEKLIRLLLLCPSTSCTAERSFSTLRRLKTWLRSTMQQKRMNHLLVSTIHQDRLDNIDPRSIAKVFCEREERRTMTFGNW